MVCPIRDPSRGMLPLPFLRGGAEKDLAMLKGGGGGGGHNKFLR